uniref:Uncharacterized protein n=1 Tax=Lepeophtheirus salmonis TaxID=72036 RepID=A0A0K2TUD1_LEPSM
MQIMYLRRMKSNGDGGGDDDDVGLLLLKASFFTSTTNEITALLKYNSIVLLRTKNRVKHRHTHQREIVF